MVMPGAYGAAVATMEQAAVEHRADCGHEHEGAGREVFAPRGAAPAGEQACNAVGDAAVGR